MAVVRAKVKAVLAEGKSVTRNGDHEQDLAILQQVNTALGGNPIWPGQYFRAVGARDPPDIAAIEGLPILIGFPPRPFGGVDGFDQGPEHSSDFPVFDRDV